MGCLKINGRECYAVSDVIAFILVFSIMTSATGFVMLWGAPYMEEKKTEARAQSALSQFGTISDIIKDDVIGQGFNSSVSVKFVTDADYLLLNSEGERFVLYYSLVSGFDFDVSGLDDGDNTFTFREESGGLAHEIQIYYLYDDTSSPPQTITGNPFDVTVSDGSFSDAVRIDIEDNTDNIIGRIWLFDTGSITYKTTSSSGVYNVIAENGGVVYGKDTNGYLSNEPNIYDRDGLLAMRIIQLKPGYTTGGSGKADYQFTIELNNSFIREDRASIPECFKMQIFGSKAAVTAWKNYLKLEHGFSQYTEGFAKGTLYLEGNREFSLTNSVCDVTMKVV